MRREVRVEVFFFSSTRRHTRCSRDWSSDVCSSDLSAVRSWRAALHYEWHYSRDVAPVVRRRLEHALKNGRSRTSLPARLRSEERRVGKEGGWGWGGWG